MLYDIQMDTWRTPPPEIALAKGGLVMVMKLTPQAQGRRSDMGNESRRSNDGKTNGSITEGIKSMGNSRDSRSTITASERVLNGAILAAEISESYEEYLEIFDHFYADDIRATADGLKEPVEGKAAVRAQLAGFLVPLHVFAEIGGVSFSIQWSPIPGDRPGETPSAWTLGLRGVTVAGCRVPWGPRRRC